jgi:hypothetical protein
MRWPLLLIAVIACNSRTSGHVEMGTEGDIVVVRDADHVLEVPLASTKGMTFIPVDLPELTLPGRLVVGDESHGYLIGVWITRLGDKRPENVQRWFDDKVDMLRRNAKILANHGMLVAGTHPARQTDFAFTAKGHPGYARLVAVDVPEHDLDVLITAIVMTQQPNAEQLVWLDAFAADVKAIHIAAK